MFKMGREKRGPLALEAWARQLTDGYPNVSVNNMTTSWRNGLAFCALIHRFRPDLIEYEKLDPADVLGNCSLAFETAESKLGIPALLDPEDMAAHEVPDRLSVLTYVAQFYSLFKNAEKKSTLPLSSLRREKDEVDLKTRSSDKSTTGNSEKIASTLNTSNNNPSNSTPPSSIPSSPSVSATKRRFETLSSIDDSSRLQAKKSTFLSPPPCSKCNNPVYITERTVFNKKLYHRKCFLCDGCHSMLNPHTADVSVDGSSFFCISKSCQLELLKLNRGGVGSDVSGTSHSSSTSTLAITDPSLLARNSIAKMSSKISDNNGHDDGCKDESEVKENIVPNTSLNVDISKSDIVTSSSGGGDDCDRDRSRVSRLTARFECVQQEENSSQVDTKLSQPTLGNSQSFIKDDDDTANYSNSNNDNEKISITSSVRSTAEEGNSIDISSKNISNYSTGMNGTERLDGAEEIDKNIVTQSTSISDIQETMVDNMSKDVSFKQDTKSNDASTNISSDNAENKVSEIDDARSNWLRGQIQPEEEKMEVEKIPEYSASSSNEKEAIEPGKIPEQNVENTTSNSDPVILDSIVTTENHEESVADSGISSSDGVDVANVAISIITVSDETDSKIDTSAPESIDEKLGEECQEEISREQSTENLPIIIVPNQLEEEEKVLDSEAETGTESSLSAITPTDPKPEIILEESSPRSEEVAAVINDSQNPFGEEDESLEVEKSSKESKYDTNTIAQNDDSAISGANELPSSDIVPTTTTTTDQTSSDPVQDTTMKCNLIPSPRKKKRAPQPSPQLGQNSHDAKRPVPSPRAQHKSRYSMPVQASSSKQEEYPVELNPFGDDEEEVKPQPSPKPRPKSSYPAISEPASSTGNPFDEEDEEIQRSSLNEEKTKSNGHGQKLDSLPPKPIPRTSTPKPFNPFEDDEEDIGEYGEDDKPTGIFARKSHDDASSISSKTSDLSNTSGITGVGFSSSSHLQKSFNASDLSSQSGSTRLKSRKSHRAPLPPGMFSGSKQEDKLGVANSSNATPPSPKKVIPVSPELKDIKNKVNKVQYKKKRRAPPPKRRVEPLPEEQIKTELSDLEIKQRELERQGISLEGNIRQLMCQDEEPVEEPKEPKDSDSNSNSNSGEQLDEMIIQLWNIVNEKNEILRRQTELEYLRRSHRLEEMQSELEFQLRILMDTPEDQRAENHARTEQLLLDELLKLVDERNEVVDWLDYYRQMDREEEMHVNKSITEYKSQSSLGIAEMVSQLKQKAKKDKTKKEKSKEDKVKNGSILRKSSKVVKSDELGSDSDPTSSKSGKKKDGKSSALGIFSTLRKKTTKKHKSIIEEKDAVENVSEKK